MVGSSTWEVDMHSEQMVRNTVQPDLHTLD